MGGLPRRADGYGPVRPTPAELDPRLFTLPDSVPALPGDGFAAAVGKVPAEVLATPEPRESDAIRTAGEGTRVVGGHITGGTTGIDTAAATTVTNTRIDQAETGIRSRSKDPVEATGVTIDALDVGVDVGTGSPFVLTDSTVHALQSARGDVVYKGTNDLSLPPLNVLSAIGIPMVALAVVLELVHLLRQKRFGIGRARRRPPTIPVSVT